MMKCYGIKSLCGSSQFKCKIHVEKGIIKVGEIKPFFDDLLIIFAVHKTLYEICRIVSFRSFCFLAPQWRH